MPSPGTILFDLDGTLSDGGEGMTESLAHACRRLCLAVPGEETLRSFIGPPFATGFARYFGLDEEGCARAVAAYRERYVDGGAMFKTAPYPGIPELVDELLAAGHRLAVATSKPEPYARQVVEHLGLLAKFAGVFGPPVAGGVGTKAEVVGEACARLGLEPSDTLMVGDREYDVLGAAAHGIDCVGVLWGFGSRDELERAGACALVAEPAELAALLRRGFGRQVEVAGS